MPFIMQEEEAPPPAPVEEAAAPEPPPPPPAEPEREFDITKCVAHSRLHAATSPLFFFCALARCRQAEAAPPLSRVSCVSVSSYSITITLAVVFVLAKAAGYFGLINN